MPSQPDAQHALIEAAKQRDRKAIEHLLQHGAEVDARGTLGRTALHHAVAGDDVETAAYLLAHGAGYGCRDDEGHAALDAKRVAVEVLHAIRQRYHRFPRSNERLTASATHASGWAAALARRGIVKVAGLVAAAELQVMRSEFAGFVSALGSKAARGEATKRHYFEEEHWWPDERAFISNNAFKHSAQLARFSLRPDLLEAARRYLGRTPIIQRAVAMRYLASASTDNDMFGWHHDLEDKRFKVMILLTDVGPNDQHMRYVCGSHALFHPYAMFIENTCALEYCRELLGTLEIYDAVGHAGDVFLFDTNGAHRGIRCAGGRVRDVYLVELNASSANVWGGDIAPSMLDEIRQAPGPFERFLKAEKKWEARETNRSPSWITTLPHLESWI